MATASCITTNGVRSAAEPFTTRSRGCITRVGVGSAASQVAWAGKRAQPRHKDWLPPMRVKPVREDGSWNPDVYRALQWLFEQFAGGINGRTVVEVVTELQQTQAEVVATASYAQAVGQYAQSVGQTAQAVVQVAQNANLGGADNVPETSEPPTFTRQAL